MRISLQHIFARVDDDNVEAVLRLAAVGWFVVAVLLLLMVIVAGAAGHLAGGDVVDPVVSALGGYFLRKTKSRSLAGALLVYAVITAALCLAKLLGLTSNGVPLLTAVIALWAGWRGWTATWFWQTRACALTNWNRVAAGAALAMVITIVVLCAMRIGFANSETPHGLIEFLMTAVLFLTARPDRVPDDRGLVPDAGGGLGVVRPPARACRERSGLPLATEENEVGGPLPTRRLPAIVAAARC
jgi:hypothetical protein